MLIKSIKSKSLYFSHNSDNIKREKRGPMWSICPSTTLFTTIVHV